MPLTKKKLQQSRLSSKSAKKITPNRVWTKELKSLMDENKKVAKALKETQKIVGSLGNRFGDFAEATLVPDLKKKFKKYNFAFERMNNHVTIDNEENDIHTEIDAMLENGAEVMVVEVKSALKKSDVDDHIKRMEKVRSYADLRHDSRNFFGAIAATIIDKDTRLYVLREGFYLIEPSGESVKIVPPVAAAKFW